MQLLAKHFLDNRPRPKFEMGTRVFGYHQKQPFIGTTGADNLRDTNIGPQVSILLDLPVQINGIRTSVIRVSYSEIKSVLVEL